MKHFNYILIICILTNVYISAPSNNTEKLDSLILQFKLTDNDSLKYAALRNIYTLLGTLDKDTVLMSWELLATYCEKEKYYLGAGYCYNNLARELRKAGEYYKSYENYLKSETYYKDIGDKRGLAGVYNGLGSLYADLEKPEQSFEHYIKSVQLYQEFKDTIWEGNVYLNLGGMLEEQDS
ncbi:MAG: tetratricopeptide repeat protein, partial [Bacteroidota bacterium]